MLKKDILPVVFLGPPGSGKGTQAKKIAERNVGWVHISTGDLFRAEVKSGSALGEKIKGILAAGQLVSDDVTNQVFRIQTEKIISEKKPRVLILDGYPRTEAQAQNFLDYCMAHPRLMLPVTLEFDINEDEVVERLSNRLVNPRTGKIYHRISNPPKREGICDEDGGPLEQRSDDRPETIRKRYQIYVNERDGILRALNKTNNKTCHHRVSAVGDPETIFSNITRFLTL